MVEYDDRTKQFSIPLSPSHVADTHAVLLGLNEIFRLLEANALRVEECQLDPDSAGRSPKPFNNYSVCVLLGMGKAVSQMLADRIELVNERL